MLRSDMLRKYKRNWKERKKIQLLSYKRTIKQNAKDLDKVKVFNEG